MQNLCIFHTWCTELSLYSQAFVTSSIWFFLVCKINTKAQGRSGKSSTCSDVRRIRKHMGHCRNVGIHNWSTRHRKEARQCSLAVYSGFACICVFSTPKEPAYLGLQNYLLGWMRAALVLCVPTQRCQKYISSITQYWLLTILIPCLLVLFSLDVLHISLA